jgi:hypothetical protein
MSVQVTCILEKIHPGVEIVAKTFHERQALL